MAFMSKMIRCKSGRIFFAAFAVMMVISAILTAILECYRMDLENIQMRYAAEEYSKKLSESLTMSLMWAETLCALIAHGNSNPSDFEWLFSALTGSEPVVHSLTVAPGGIIAYVYPYEDNAGTLGHNFLEGTREGDHGAILAAEKREITVGGPFSSFNGEPVVTAWLPVFVQNGREFWGVVSMALRYPDVFSDVDATSLHAFGYGLEVWRGLSDTNERSVIVHINRDKDYARYVDFPLTALNSNWVVRVVSYDGWFSEPYSVVFLAICIAISLAIALIAKNYFETWHRRVDMEDKAMHDVLTGLLNRRSFIDMISGEIKTATQSGRHFVLAFIDLNGFKAINDTYGHKYGDVVLVEVSRRLKAAAGDRAVIFRLGGDEFTMIFSRMFARSSLLRVVELINTGMRDPVEFDDGRSITISVSVGLAVFPDDGRTMEDLTAHADATMYSNKRDMAQRHTFRKTGGLDEGYS